MPDVIVDVADEPDTQNIDPETGAVLRIEHGDGSVTVSLDGKPLNDNEPDSFDEKWFGNLALRIEESELGRIADELLRGIQDDEQSRKDWIDARATGINLLGLKIEVPGLQGASDGAPVEGMSKVRHPLLLEAVLRFQANARSELLPTDGPVKVRVDATGGSASQEDQIGDWLEQDLNHYLTAVATEYYPDTDRMLLMLGFGGTAFKKVYFCPLRMRPVSETVNAIDLIVNDAATDLANAKRVTQKISMKPSTVKRMQILGIYRDVDLGTPTPATPNSAERAEKEQQGVKADAAANPEDRNRDIYECYCELEIAGFEHKWKGKPSGLEIPYRVTIDVSSRQILSIVRNYDSPDENRVDPLPEARKVFVKYTFVPGLGFYDIGLLHILGNTTNALTAAWREMLDNGMYANFPGFLVAKQATRQNTSILRIPPGGGQQIDVGGMRIQDAVMPVPYNTQQMAPLQQLTTQMEQDGQRIGGVSELQVGEGRPDAPVGTTLAMIEQATKILNSVHKRMHAAQAEEFKLLTQCFREHPESFFERGCVSPNRWTAQTVIQALDNCDLVPQADPNTASHGERVMKVQALNLWQAANPSLANPVEIGKVTLTAMGWSNPEQFMAPPEAMSQPPPELLELQAKTQATQQDAQSRALEAQAKMALAQAKIQEARHNLWGGQQQPDPNSPEVMSAQARLLDAHTKRQDLVVQQRRDAIEDQNRDKDRDAKREETFLDLAKEILHNPQAAEVGAREVGPITREIGARP